MSASLWVVVEHEGSVARKVSLELLGRGRELGATTCAVLLGAQLETLATSLAGLADSVLAVQDPRLSEPRAQAAVLARLARELQPSLVLAGATTAGCELMPRLAVLLDAGYAARCTALDLQDGWLLRRPVQGGKAYAELSAPFGAGTVLATLRPNSYSAPPPSSGGVGGVRWLEAGDLPAAAVRQLGFTPSPGGRVPIDEAEVVVAGGRGVGSPAGFGLLEQLADVLGGAVGASRAVVDAGLRPLQEQVGKSGKTISPRLYIAVGISGAVHHTMGMDTAGTVVAINSDPSAIVFQHADLGLVGDASVLLPALIEHLR